MRRPKGSDRDFNPVDAAKRLVREISKQGTSNPDKGILVDYVTALRTALELALPYVNKIADEWDDQHADTLLHTIRHLLDD